MTLPHYTSTLLQSPSIPLVHGFYTRQGGVSAGVYESLNVHDGRKDRVEDISENLQRIAVNLDIDKNNIITAQQKCSANVVIVNEHNKADIGDTEADALVTNKEGLAIGIMTADCAPILLYCAQSQTIAACHGSWHGLYNDIISHTLSTMKKLGAQIEHIVCAIGPCIQQESYEIDQPFFEHFIKKDSITENLFTPPHSYAGHRKFDLSGLVKYELQKHGVQQNQIDDLGLNTYTNPELFFSCRYNQHAGLKEFGDQISLIMLRST